MDSSERVADTKTYFGGKAGNGTFQTIINHIRPHQVYIEGFLGAGAIFWKKKRASTSYLIDKYWKCIERAKRGLYSKGFQEVAPAHGMTILSKPGQEEYVQVRMQCAFEQVPFLVDCHLQNEETVCVYLDPPYPHESRKSADKNRYQFELADQDHVRLLEMAKSLKCDVLISTYPNDLYRNELKDWTLVEFQSMTHAGLATEWLFFNYPIPEELHDYRYVGKDNRERLDFNRRKSDGLSGSSLCLRNSKKP